MFLGALSLENETHGPCAPVPNRLRAVAAAARARPGPPLDVQMNSVSAELAYGVRSVRCMTVQYPSDFCARAPERALAVWDALPRPAKDTRGGRTWRQGVDRILECACPINHNLHRAGSGNWS